MACTLTLRLWALLVASSLSGNQALIVSPRPSLSSSQATAKLPINSVGRENVSVARIRTARRADLEPISELLSTAIAGEDTTNWRVKMERLRIKASLKSRLDMRIRALEEAKKQLSRTVQMTEGTLSVELGNADHLRYLWSNDSFRNKVRHAALQTSEPTPWEHHNFALAPEDPGWLRHEMIKAEDVDTGSVVGFVEIATLRCPAFDQPDESGKEFFMECAPTIANLVVSPNWRGRGVAKGLVKSAERLVQRKWKCNELGLYVEKRNQRALNLYSKAGYQVVASIHEEDQPHKWYMSKVL